LADRPERPYPGSRVPPPRRSTDDQMPRGTSGREVLKGQCYVIDGDTIVINGTHIRLAGIDAPEMDQPWGKKAKFAMIAWCKGKIVTAEIQEGLSYDRIVAKCSLPDGTDLSAALVEQGLALDWAKFSGGAYRHLEPDGVRKKLWRVRAKHKGRLKKPSS
jgi:micrococcal nuclease